MTVGRRGRNGPKGRITAVRELTTAEVMELDELAERPRVPVVQKMRDSHLMVARLIATGMGHGEVARAMGYTAARISMLAKDPAFQALVQRYRQEVVDPGFTAGVATFAEMALKNMAMAERMLMDKLEIADEEGDLPSIRDLVTVVGDRADRFGYPKHNTSTNLNIDFAGRLDQAIRRSKQALSRDAAAAPASKAVSGPAQPEVLPPLRRIA